MNPVAPTPLILPALSGLRILVADDCEDNQYLLNRILARLGAKVSLASDGADACELALKEPFDILLFDIEMPVMDGYEAVKKLKSSGYLRPILAVTGSSSDEDRGNILAAGFCARVVKPIDSKFLALTIQEALANSVNETLLS